jgi:hypothetical protein
MNLDGLRHTSHVPRELAARDDERGTHDRIKADLPVFPAGPGRASGAIESKLHDSVNLLLFSITKLHLIRNPSTRESNSSVRVPSRCEYAV